MPKQFNYLAKAVYQGKDIVDYTIMGQTSSLAKPRGKEYEILIGVDTKYPKAVKLGSIWKVVEDDAQKTQQTQKEATKEARKAQLIAAINQLDSASKLTDIIPVLKKVLQHIFNQ